MNNASLGNVWVVSIHDKAPQGGLAFDVREILASIYDYTAFYEWMAYDLDCTGTHIGEGIPLNTERLLALSAQLKQTIDGCFVGYSTKCPSVDVVRQDVAHFPTSRASIVVVAVDSAFFEVYTKEIGIVERIKTSFRDVRDEDTSHYFV